MKVNLEILDDQIELLNRIKQIPKMIEDHVGRLPQAFPGGDYEIAEIRQAVANLEFKCKKMIFDTCIVKEKLTEILDGTHLDSNSFKKGDWD